MSWTWLFLLSLAILVVVRYKKSSRGTPLPPGPPADPFIGHIRSIPAHGQDMYYYELGLKYGDVVHLKALGQTLIVLNSVRAAVDLLEKRGTIYSDRVHFPVFELFGMSQSLILEKYGPEWRIQRTIMQQHFSKDMQKVYRPIQTREARVLAQNLFTSTDERLKVCLRFATAVIIDITYGHRIDSDEDPYLKIAGECSQLSADSGNPGATPIDIFPFLRHFPSWFPGTYYATFARNALPKFLKLYTYPYGQLKEQMAKGIAKPSILASMMEDLQNEGEEDEAKVRRIQALSATIYMAGAETTSSAVAFFLLAMVLYPEFQTKAREEIDAVIGTGRLPEFEDRVNLPYVECILQETIRWNQPTPAGVPHKSTEDDVYNGMLIPKGSMVIANARAMTLDESVYKDPFKFDPARFLPAPVGRGEPHPVGHFGFGRRICPGRYLGEDNMWIAIVTILATTTISRAIGNDGKEIIPEGTVVLTGAASHPTPFPCDIKPRSEAAFKLLQGTTEIEC